MTGRSGLVVAGAGARGAYEAGALSVLVPRMATAGAAPTVLLGTSAGALNVTGLAALLHEGVQEAVQGLVDMWGGVRLEDVVDVPASVVHTGLGYGAQLAGLPVRLPSLLDTRPQRETLERLVSVEALHENVRNGLVDAVGVVTTAVATGATVIFVEARPGVDLPPPDLDRNIHYVATELTLDHVLASAAVPVAFRPVFVERPEEWRGWYVDGGLRLNVPLKPALDLGCDRLGVVATSPAQHVSGPPSSAEPGAPTPDVFGVAALVLRSLLADRMVEDLHTLSLVNRLVAAARTGATPYRLVDVLFAGPVVEEAEAIARLAAEAFARRYGGLRGLRNPSIWALERLIGGSTEDSGELLSTLFFDGAFTRPAAGLGAAHARARLADEDVPWLRDLGTTRRRRAS